MKTPQQKVEEAIENLNKAREDYQRIGGPYLFKKLNDCGKKLKELERKRNLANTPKEKQVLQQFSLL